MNAFLTFLEMKVILGKWNIEYDEILKKTSEEDLSSDMSDFYFEKQEKILSWIEEKKKEFDLYGFKKLLKSVRRHIKMNCSFNYVPQQSMRNLFLLQD